MTNRSYRNQVHQDFLQRQELAQGRAEALFGGMDTLNREEREALEFLYAYMPYSDLADYDQSFYLQQIRTAFAARDTFSWGREVPEDIFRHFVLVYRVNNENLDSARMVFFRELKDRVKGLPMEQAALEVNHWCHEHVAYRAADARTSAPLATMRTSLGRCGEESTFAVTALRAVGIPARQCYTPRWAHCDDNHAWVEVWVTDSAGEGHWKHLGACEPDPALDMGWFDIPSTRCMMVHSKAFGRYQGDEEVVVSTPLYSELNLLGHYAPTRRVTVIATWTKEDGMTAKPVADAEVKFKLYNYSEYYTLATVKTDANGQASLTTGLGDLLIWACKGDAYGYEKLDVRKQDTITILMDHEGLAPYHVPAIEEFHIVPPAPGEAKVTPTDEAVAANAVRIAYEDSLRAAYTATFPTAENFKTYLPKSWCWSPDIFSDEQVWEILQKSEGNYAEIVKFFESWSGPERSCEHIYDYLKSYSDKDLRDITAEVLESHITTFDWADRKKGTSYEYQFDYEVYKRGLMPARISNELVRPWRKPLAEALKDTKGYEALKAWTKEHITVDDTGNYYNCPISPMGVYELRHADAHSRDIFYVAACRALGIPAYLDNATNIIYAWDKEWHQVSFSEDGNAGQYHPAKITLTYHGKEPVKPIYYTHFTLQKYEDGDFVTYDFEGDPRMESFPATIEVDGSVYYCLSTGSRYPDGEVINRREYISFDDEVGDSVSREIIIPELVERVQGTEGQVDPYMDVVGQVKLADYAGSKGAIIAFMGSHREPSKHLVKEIVEHKGEFEAWGGRIFCTTTLDPKNGELQQIPNSDIRQLPTGTKDQLELAVAKSLNEGSYEYPLVLYADKEGRILFHSTGYQIGLAELLLKYCK